MSSHEHQSLLGQASGLYENQTNRQQKKQRQQQQPHQLNSSSEEDEWSSSYSTSSSFSGSEASDESYIPEWDSFIQPDGNLFYIEYEPLVNMTAAALSTSATTNSATINPPQQKSQNEFSKFQRSSTRRSKKAGSKLSKLMNRNLKPLTEAIGKNKDQKSVVQLSPSLDNQQRNQPQPQQQQHHHQTQNQQQQQENQKVKFSEIAEGEIKEIPIIIDPSMRHKYGRRASVSEAILGISTCPFPDGKRIMVAGYMPNSRLGQEKCIKVGDWLKAINHHEVFVENLDKLLLGFNEPTEIRLILQRMSGEEQILIYPDEMFNKITCIEDMLDHVEEIFGVYSDVEVDGTGAGVGAGGLSSFYGGENDMPFSLMYLATETTSNEIVTEGQEVLFCYPAKNKNCLYPIRGTFLTLNSLLKDIFASGPLCTTVKHNNVDYYVFYKKFNEELLLAGYSSARVTHHEAKQKTNEIVRCIEFLHQTTSSIFSPSSLFLSQSSSSSSSPNTNTNNKMENWKQLFHLLGLLYKKTELPISSLMFEEMLPEIHYMPLPKEAQLRIDDALCEMEAMDYRDWNDEPLKSHREFYIIGSALYFKRYLLASHLPSADLLDIETFLRIFQIRQFMEKNIVRDLVIWQEIYPKSVERGIIQKDNIYGIPRGRWFLAIIARNQMLLAVILESRHENSDTLLCITPSPFYIEEIQDTFEHLITGGIESLTSTWINSNKRPQIVLTNLSNEMATTAAAAAAAAAVTTSHSSPEKKPEIISILKRRNNSTENVGDVASGGGAIGGGGFGCTSVGKYPQIVPSSSSTATAGTSTTSLVGSSSVNSEELNHDGSDSDWDGFPDSQRSSSGFDMSDLNETLLREVSDVIPSRITAGNENVLFYYVQVDVGHGTLLAPTCVPPNDAIICEFRKACFKIHTVLQNTIRFRYLLAQESSKATEHRSLVAIKEHGILISIEIEPNEHTEFWVIGRLFTSPAKEFYVCHRSDIPQNLVEMAFRLSLHTAG